MANIDKVVIDKELLNDIITKTWQDIENIQSQIAGFDNEDYKTAELKKLLTNLLTSYYIFAGCAENMLTDFGNIKPLIAEPDFKETKKFVAEPKPELTTTIDEIAELCDVFPEDDNFEPFEYFVDFDEPIGEKLTDEDIYKI